MTRVDGARLRRLREGAGLTREDFLVRARELGHDISIRTLAAMELGEGLDARLSSLGAVAAVLGVRVDSLLVDDAA